MANDPRAHLSHASAGGKRGPDTTSKSSGLGHLRARNPTAKQPGMHNSMSVACRTPRQAAPVVVPIERYIFSYNRSF